MRVIAVQARLRWPFPVAMRLTIAMMCSAGLGGVPSVLRAQGDALTLSEILDLHRRGVSSRQILRGAQQYCVAFTVTDSVERALMAAGADTALVTGVREACVATSPAARLEPGVLLDDDFTATSMPGLRAFTAADRLCAVRPSPTGRGLRVENRRTALGCAIEYPFEVGGHTGDASDTSAAGGVRVELTVAELGGGRGAAVVLGFGKAGRSWDQYSFALTSEGRVELCLSAGGRCERLLSEKRAAPAAPNGPIGPSGPAVPGGPAGPGGAERADHAAESRLAVEIRGREVSLYVDGAPVGTYSAGKVVAGGLSLGVGAHSTAVFRRLRVVRLEGLATSR
jgi:hypothetical protein